MLYRRRLVHSRAFKDDMMAAQRIRIVRWSRPTSMLGGYHHGTDRSTRGLILQQPRCGLWTGHVCERASPRCWLSKTHMAMKTRTAARQVRLSVTSRHGLGATASYATMSSPLHRQKAPTNSRRTSIDEPTNNNAPRPCNTPADPVTKDLGLIFPGQGSQYVRMALDIYQTFPAAKAFIDEAEGVLDFPLRKIMFEGPNNTLIQTEYAQPAILTASLAILCVLEEEYGFSVERHCALAMGHSLGEYTALVAAKALDPMEAVKLVHARGIAMRQCVDHQFIAQQHTDPLYDYAMSALILQDASLLPDLEEALRTEQANLETDSPYGQGRSEILEIANVNSSLQIVLSGTKSAVTRFSHELQRRGIAARAVDLPVGAPFHCRLLEPAAELLRATMALVDFKQPVVPVISNVTAKPFEDAKAIGPALIQQVTSPVLWYPSIRYCLSHVGVHHFVELGPRPVLGNLLRREHPKDDVYSACNVSTLRAFRRYFDRYLRGESRSQ